MFNIKVNFNQKEVDDINRSVKQIGESIDDCTKLWEALVLPISAAIKDNFENQGNFKGGWAQLNPEYLAWKSRTGKDTRILRSSGTLFNAATVKDAAYNLTVIEPKQMIYGVSGNLPYAHRHDVGDPGGKPIKQREYMILNPTVVNDAIDRAIAVFVKETPALSTGVEPARRKT